MIQKHILKSGREPSIKALKDEVKSEARVEIIVEDSPEYKSKASGELEIAMQMVQGHIRAMKDRLECRYRARLDGTHDSMPC